MTHHPLLLSTPMVQAVRAGNKLETKRIPGLANSFVDGRRVSGKIWKEYDWDMKEYQIDPGPSPAGNPGPYFKFRSKAYDTIHRIYPVYEVGDWIWFRETAYKSYKGDKWFYKADYKKDFKPDQKWRPSIHLPKEGARLWAEITAVSCQHLQDITEEDAKREGVQPAIFWDNTRQFENIDEGHICWGTQAATYKNGFQKIWQELHGPESWSANPPVYPISFKILSTTGMPANQGV